MEYHTIIEPNKVEKNYWKDIWHYRELFLILSWRDIKVRYKQTVVGALWAILRPFLTMVVFTIVFSKVANLPSEGNAPYALMVFAALLPWQFFANALTEASGSLVSNSNLITKVYFPRIIVPASSVITSVIDFFISFFLLIILMVCYSYQPSLKILALPLFLLLAFITSFGVGLLITSLNVKYRDFRYIIPFIIQFGLYISPVGFSSDVVPEKWRFLFNLNPMVGVIDSFRWSIIQNSSFPMESLIFSVILSFLFLGLGVFSFRKLEKSFADNI